MIFKNELNKINKKINLSKEIIKNTKEQFNNFVKYRNVIVVFLLLLILAMYK